MFGYLSINSGSCSNWSYCDMKKLIIAIDGYSSCGKSTFARLIAAKLGYIFIDTGAMYRAVTLFMLDNKLTLDQLESSLADIAITFVYSENLGRSEIFLNGVNVDKDIRSSRVNDSVSGVAQVKAVRVKLVDMQRNIGKSGGVVMDGRDIGSVVFPSADIKIFMTADAGIRAKRRYDEMGGSVTLDEVERNIRARDLADETRVDSPLVRAADALVLDNSFMSVEQQMEWVDSILKKFDV